MTQPDSVGKVVAENDWQFILGRRNADGLFADRVYWCAETGAIRIETTSDGRFRAGEGPEIRKPRLQALDRQRQEECEALRASVEQLREQVRFNGKAMDAVANSMREVGCTFDSNRTPIIRNDRAETAEAALREADRDAERLDYIERTFSAVTNCERYLPVTMIWGKGCNGRTLREACDKHMSRLVRDGDSGEGES